VGRVGITLFAIACSEPAAPPTEIAMDYGAAEFFDAPFPDEARRRPDGTADLAAFPNGTHVELVDRLIAIASETEGFATTSTVFFRAKEPLDPASVETDYETSLERSTVALVNVESSSPSFGRRHPIEVRLAEHGGPFGAPSLLSLLPLQGLPLEANALYAAFVTDGARDAGGRPLGVPASLRALVAGRAPDAMSEEAFAQYQVALDALETNGIDASALVALTVFRTADPTAGLRDAYERALALPPPIATDLTRVETFTDLCVYEGLVQMPDYQRGEPPYSEGGAWDLETPPRMVDARIVIAIPIAHAGPLPTVVFSRTGGGGDRPLIDRGVHDASGAAIEPGSGPAREMARAGWASVSIDGPHGGLRNPEARDEQFLIFNVANPIAMRDNVRQSALELALAARMLDGLVIDDCSGEPIALDPRALMGHSMGATIAPLAFAIEPAFEVLLLSGAGGSWIENVVFKASPVEVRPFAELILGVSGRYALHEHDPALMLLQWAGESADPPAYAALAGRDRHVLMMQGIVDTYILPPIANATSLSFGLDLAGDPLDASEPRLAEFASLEPRLAFSGRGLVALPVRGLARVVVQHSEDGVEDGHEVVFQTDPPKAQYRCLLETLAAGAPVVPAAAGPCP
jgi:hypothetical protein